MKNKKRSGSLFALLARNYLLFTFTLLAVAAVLFAIWNARLTGLYRPVDWEALRTDPAMGEDDYSRLERYLGETGALAVYDEAGELRYASMDDFDPFYTQGEFSCIRPYGDRSRMDAFETVDEEGEPRHLLVRRTYENGTETAVDLMALDQDYQVVSA